MWVDGAEQQIWDLIDRSNDAWLTGDPRDTAALFAPDARLVAPAIAAAVDGREAIVDTYVEMTAATTTDRFEVTDRSVHVAGDTAVATYVFEIEYRVSGERHDERGQEILVLRRSAEGWQAVWRTQVALPDG